uniref:Uncharacterized protein n=1 Tax=Triticum urartu TaxID=4572 RepID=A0A8R7UIY2_TRIUA
MWAPRRASGRGARRRVPRAAAAKRSATSPNRRSFPAQPDKWRSGWLVKVDGEARDRRQGLGTLLRSASDGPGDLMVFRVHGGHQVEEDRDADGALSRLPLCY